MSFRLTWMSKPANKSDRSDVTVCNAVATLLWGQPLKNKKQRSPSVLAMSPALCPILPKHIYGDGTDLKVHPRNSTDVVGSGPFKLTEFKAGQRLVLERHIDHAGDVQLGDDQKMDGRPGVDVMEREDVLVFVHLARRNLARNDFAKNTVGVGHGLL